MEVTLKPGAKFSFFDSRFFRNGSILIEQISDTSITCDPWLLLNPWMWRKTHLRWRFWHFVWTSCWSEYHLWRMICTISTWSLMRAAVHKIRKSQWEYRWILVSGAKPVSEDTRWTRCISVLYQELGNILWSLSRTVPEDLWSVLHFWSLATRLCRMSPRRVLQLKSWIQAMWLDRN